MRVACSIAVSAIVAGCDPAGLMDPGRNLGSEIADPLSAQAASISFPWQKVGGTRARRSI